MTTRERYWIAIPTSRRGWACRRSSGSGRDTPPGLYEDEPTYLTIDDIRLVRYVECVREVVIDPPQDGPIIEVLNHTRSYEEIRQVLENTDELVIIVGVQTPGKYLSARPGTLHEVEKLLRSFEEAADR